MRAADSADVVGRFRGRVPRSCVFVIFHFSFSSEIWNSWIEEIRTQIEWAFAASCLGVAAVAVVDTAAAIKVVAADAAAAAAAAAVVVVVVVATTGPYI